MSVVGLLSLAVVQGAVWASVWSVMEYLEERQARRDARLMNDVAEQLLGLVR